MWFYAILALLLVPSHFESRIENGRRVVEISGVIWSARYRGKKTLPKVEAE